jgi:hypothetical protein
MFWSPLQRRENGPIAFHAPRLIRHRMPWVGSRGCERFDEKDHPHFQWFKARSATKPDPVLSIAPRLAALAGYQTQTSARE